MKKAVRRFFVVLGVMVLIGLMLGMMFGWHISLFGLAEVQAWRDGIHLVHYGREWSGWINFAKEDYEGIWRLPRVWQYHSLSLRATGLFLPWWLIVVSSVAVGSVIWLGTAPARVGGLFPVEISGADRKGLG